MRSVTELQVLLDKVVTNDCEQTKNIAVLGEKLEEKLLSEVLAGLESDPTVNGEVVTRLVRSLVSLPDRTINVIGTDKDKLPDWIYPPHYCGILLSHLATCLSSCSSLEASSWVSSQLYESLYWSYPDHVLSCRPWWRYLVSSPHHTRAFMARLNSNTRLKAVINVLRYSTDPETLQALFSDSVTESQVLEILLVRGLAWLGPEEVWCLVRYLATSQADHQDLASCLVRLVSVWGDELEIDQGELHYLSILSWTVCSLLGSLQPQALDRVRQVCLRRLTAGVSHWLEADLTKRQLGMCSASVILQTVGGSVPDWTLEDTHCLEVLRSLAQRDRPARTTAAEGEDQEKWGEVSESRGNISTNKTVDKRSEPDLDSDDSEAEDSDDDLPAYDMSDDKPWDKDHKPILYVRDIMDQLADPDSTQQEECLQKMVEFSKSRLQHEDPAVVLELVSLTLHLQNKFESPDWGRVRQAALTSVTSCRPAVLAPSLVKRLFEKEVTLDTKFTVLESLVEAGTVLRETNSGKLGEFLSLTVSGLCGGGWSWARLKVRGLETSLVTQCVLSLARLVRLGENTPGWYRHLQLSTELLLAVAGSHSKVPVQAAVLHGLGVVGSVVPAHLLTGGELGQMLATAAGWAAGLTGDLAESGTATANMLRVRQQEGLRLEMERDLVQSTEIKMTIDKKQVKLK